MTIEINGRLSKGLLIAAALVLVLSLLTGLALLGRGYTFDGQVLTWTDWRVLQARDAYRSELGGLQRDADVLVELLNATVPDPVRGQIVADQIAQRWAVGNAALVVPRTQLIEAAGAVRDWVTGAASRDGAQAAVDELLTRLQEAAQAVASESTPTTNTSSPALAPAVDNALPRVGDHLPDTSAAATGSVTATRPISTSSPVTTTQPISPTRVP